MSKLKISGGGIVSRAPGSVDLLLLTAVTLLIRTKSASPYMDDTWIAVKICSHTDQRMRFPFPLTHRLTFSDLLRYESDFRFCLATPTYVGEYVIPPDPTVTFHSDIVFDTWNRRGIYSIVHFHSLPLASSLNYPPTWAFSYMGEFDTLHSSFSVRIPVNTHSCTLIGKGPNSNVPAGFDSQTEIT